MHVSSRQSSEQPDRFRPTVYSGALRAGVSFAARGSPETEATGHWPLHDPLSRDVMVFGEGNGSGARLRQNPRAAELAAWGGFRRLAASRL